MIWKRNKKNYGTNAEFCAPKHKKSPAFDRGFFLRGVKVSLLSLRRLQAKVIEGSFNGNGKADALGVA